MTNEAEKPVEVDLNMPQEDVLPFVDSLTMTQAMAMFEGLDGVIRNAKTLQLLVKIHMLSLKVSAVDTHPMPETVQ